MYRNVEVEDLQSSEVEIVAQQNLLLLPTWTPTPYTEQLAQQMRSGLCWQSIGK